MSKRMILVVLSLVLLTGCSLIQVPKEKKYDGPTGKLLINIRPQTIAREIPTATTHIRIVLDGGSPGVIRNIKVDKAVTEFPTTIEVPVGEYTIKVVAYKKDTASVQGIALTYATTTVTIEEGKAAQTSLVLERIKGPTLQKYDDYLYNETPYEIKFNKNPQLQILNVNGLELKMSYSVMFYGDTNWTADLFSENNVRVNSRGSHPYYYYYFVISTPEDFGKSTYYQVQIPIANKGMEDLYFFIPCLALEESLGELKTAPLSDLELIIE